MKRSTIVVVIAVILAISIIVFTFFGCSCWRKTTMAPPTTADIPKVVEGFESSPNNKPLNPQETELFEDLMNNRLSEDDIKTLVQNNILNQQLVEKFLDKLTAADTVEVDEMKKKEEIVEGFTSVGNTFACAEFGPGQ